MLKRTFSVAAGLAFTALSLGCASSSAPAAANNASAPPRSEAPGVLAVTATDFMDTDGNRYRDTSTVVVYIFSESAQYQLPMRAAGSFDFSLESEGKTIAAWRYTPIQAAQALRDLAPGPGFVFELSLFAGGGGDGLTQSQAELVTSFTPSDGDRPLKARTQSPLLVGSVGRSGGVRP